MWSRISKNTDYNGKTLGLLVCAMLVLSGGVTLLAPIAGADGCTDLGVGIEFGTPIDFDAFNYGGELIDRISNETPITISCGCCTGEAKVVAPSYELSYVLYLYDGGVFVPVKQGSTCGNTMTIYADESCLHELEVTCSVNGVRQGESESVHFLVDAEDPYASLTYGSPSYGSYIKSTTPFWVQGGDTPQGDCSSGLANISARIDTGCTQVFEHPYDVPFFVTGEGPHDVHYWSTDGFGHESPLYYRYVYVDETGPEVFMEGGISPIPGGLVMINSGEHVIISADDGPGCGVASIHFTVDGIFAYEFDMDSVNYPFMDPGFHTITCWAIDNLGNVGSSKTQRYYVDDMGPVVELEVDVPHRRIDMTTWVVSSDTLLWLNATDYTPEDHVESLHWNVFKSSPQYVYQSDSTSGDAAVFALGDYSSYSCYHELQYWAYDMVGNNGPLGTAMFYVDSEAPEFDNSFTGPRYTKDLVDYVSALTEYHIHAVDLGCRYTGGVASVDWMVNATDDLHIVGSGTVYDGQQIGYENAYVNISGDLTPAGDGIVDISVRILDNCDHFVYYQAVDIFGHESERFKKHLKVDVTEPAGTLIGTSVSFVTCGDDVGYMAHDYEDDSSICSSGVKAIHYMETYTDGTTSKEFIVSGPIVNPYTITGNLMFIDFWAEDNVSNMNTPTRLYVDCEPPIVNLEVDQPKHCDEPFIWVTPCTGINLSAWEPRDLGTPASGLIFDAWIIDGCGHRIDMPPTPYPVMWDVVWWDFIPADLRICGCSFTLYWEACDAVGHAVTGSQVFYIDDQAPVISVDLVDPFDTAYPLPDGGDGSPMVITAAWTIEVGVYDPHSCGSVGMDVFQYRLNCDNEGWSTWMDYTGPIHVVDCGTYLMEVYASDLLGHHSSWSASFIVDTCDEPGWTVDYCGNNVYRVLPPVGFGPVPVDEVFAPETQAIDYLLKILLPYVDCVFVDKVSTPSILTDWLLWRPVWVGGSGNDPIVVEGGVEYWVCLTDDYPHHQ